MRVGERWRACNVTGAAEVTDDHSLMENRVTDGTVTQHVELQEVLTMMMNRKAEYGGRNAKHGVRRNGCGVWRSTSVIQRTRGGRNETRMPSSIIIHKAKAYR